MEKTVLAILFPLEVKVTGTTTVLFGKLPQIIPRIISRKSITR
jgi:hypothetical protein